MEFQQDNYSIFNGLYTTLVRTRGYAQNTYYKIIAAQRHYYFVSSGIHFTKKQEDVITLLDASLRKFYWGCLSLEQLWGVHHHIENPDRQLPNFLDVPITTDQNELTFLFGYLLDQTLYTWRSFLDYYLKYLLLFLTDKQAANMSTGGFQRGIESYLQRNQDSRCNEVYLYIKSQVLSQTYGEVYESWGDFLRSLRDKTTHNTLIKPTIVEKENSDGYRVTWPNIRGRNYAELTQWEFGNKAFEMLWELFPILYGLEWIPGSYNPGMYENY